MIVTLFVLSSLPFVLAVVPPEVFSSVIAQKSLATFHALPSPIEYPQYTDTTAGNWIYFIPNTWTSAFFPSSLYLLNTRAELCGAASNGLGTANWLDLARSTSTALLSLNASAGLGHDVGFISDAFVAELAVWVSGFPPSYRFVAEALGNINVLEIQITKQPKQRSIDSLVCWRRGLIPSLDVRGAGTQQTQQTSRWARASVLGMFDRT